MSKKRFQKIAVSVAGILSFVICGFLYSCTSKGNNIYTIEQTEKASEQGMEGQLAVPETEQEGNTQISNCYVYVCGNVVNPGVYEAAPDARVYELIDMAGGASKTGCLEALNLADHIYDGQKLYVPDYDEYESGRELGQNEGDAFVEESNSASGLVNINTADLQQLMTLPGVGQSRAQAIVDYRNEHGSFECIEDIMNVTGIKEGAFSKLKDYICVK